MARSVGNIHDAQNMLRDGELASGLNQRYEQNMNPEDVAFAFQQNEQNMNALASDSEDVAFAFQQNEQNMNALASDFTQYFESTDKPGEVACAHQQNDKDGNAVDATGIPIDAKGSVVGNLLVALQVLMGQGFDMTGRANGRVCETMGWTVTEDGTIIEQGITNAEGDCLVNVKNVLLAVVRRLKAAINEMRWDCPTSKKAMPEIGAAMVSAWNDHGIRGKGTGFALQQGWSSLMPLIFNANTGKLGFMCKAVSWVEMILVIGGIS
jgi:hypothetical protein